MALTNNNNNSPNKNEKERERERERRIFFSEKGINTGWEGSLLLLPTLGKRDIMIDTKH